MKSPKKKIKIICPEHGIFEQLPPSHVIKKQKYLKLDYKKTRKVAIFPSLDSRSYNSPKLYIFNEQSKILILYHSPYFR